MYADRPLLPRSVISHTARGQGQLLSMFDLCANVCVCKKEGERGSKSQQGGRPQAVLRRPCGDQATSRTYWDYHRVQHLRVNIILE